MSCLTRCSLLPLILLAVLCAAPCTATDLVFSPSSAAPLARAERELEEARLRLRLYEKVEYPTQRRRLDSTIALLQAEAKMYERRVAAYENKFRYSNAITFSLEETRLNLIDAKLRLNDLREERSLLNRFRSDRCRLYQLRVEAALEAVDALLPRRPKDRQRPRATGTVVAARPN